MSDASGTSIPEERLTPEFKLQVVLEYLRNPRQKRRIIKEKGITEEQLQTWHQEFLDRAERVFGGRSPVATASAAPSSPQSIPNLNRTAAASASSELKTARAPLGWGVKLNRGWHESYILPSSSKECPTWARGFYRDEWEQERGLIVWDDTSQTMEKLWAGEVLRLMQKLREDDHWRTEGFPITRVVRHYGLKQAPKPKLSRKKKKQTLEPAVEEAEPQSKESEPDYEDVEEVIVRPNPQASVELFDFLQQHEAILKVMAGEEEKRKREAFSQVYKILFRGHHEREAQSANLSKRSLPWVHHADRHTLICDMPPNRGTVKISEDGWFWEACIEIPDRFKHTSPYFFKLEEALAWTEKELLATEEEAKAEEQPTELDTSATKSQIDLTSYLIDPAALEPTRITYRVIIYLERVPEQFKTMEMSFGKLMRYDEKYPSLYKVLDELKLEDSTVSFEQPGGINFGWYFLFSTATYYEADLARAQAQRLWESSTLQRLYKEGKVPRARYGVQEVESNFCTWLGGLEDPNHPWAKPETRAEHMANWATEETIAHALDIVRFRERLHLSPERVSDEKLLSALHQRRVRSKHIPVEARAESERWLAEHPDVE